MRRMRMVQRRGETLSTPMLSLARDGLQIPVTD